MSWLFDRDNLCDRCDGPFTGAMRPITDDEYGEICCYCAEELDEERDQ